MREIPAEVRDLLKSRSMIGDNKPMAEVVIGNADGSIRDFPDPLVPVIQGKDAIKVDGSNWMPTNDGKYMCCWFDDTTKELQTGFSNDLDFLTINYAIEIIVATPTIMVDSITGKQCALFKLNNNKVLLIAANLFAGSTWAKCFLSNTGNGDDWVYYSTIYTHGSTTIVKSTSAVAIPIYTPTGRIILNITHGTAEFGGIWSIGHIYISDNNGLSWTKKVSGTYPRGTNPAQPIILPDNTIYACISDSSNSAYIYKSNDNGDSWENVADFALWGICISFYLDGNIAYAMAAKTGIYRLENPTEDNFENKENWTKVSDYVFNTFNFANFSDIDGNLVIAETYNILSIEKKKNKLPVKAINISRNKNMAGSLNLSIDNKNGEWSPDNTVNQNVLFPNSEITVKQGYGAELVNTFTGLIDRIELTTFPQSINLSVRDKLKLALDQTISPQVITYTGQTVEGIFTDLAGKSGLTTGTIETTGLTIAEKTFSWETYADCFSWLADLVGFEFGCDEDGKVYFKKDAIPQATDWILTFTDGVAQAYFPIVSGSDILKSADGLTTYIRDTDYEIDYETGELTSLTIDDGETLMSYVFAVYSFQEGEDIISLGYTIDDNDIYSKVIVYGKDANDEVISSYKDYVSKDYYNVLSQKIMKIDVSEASTVEQLQAIADRAEMLMRSRVRTVRFAAVAVPWLQVGDLIQVVESSTTISELYRVTDLSTNMDSDGYTMQITCYHHSA